MREVVMREYNYMDRVDERKYNRIARAKQVKRQKCILAFGIFITILFITIFSIRAIAYANDSTPSSQIKQFSSIMIYCGDSVETIAENYYIINGYPSAKSIAEEIRSINHISSNDKLIPGNYIVIPYFVK